MKIAMIGHKVVPSTRGGIETVLTNLCPIMAEKGNGVVCYNRTADRSEKVFEKDIKNGMYKGVSLKKARTLKIKGLSAMLSSFTAAFAWNICSGKTFESPSEAAANLSERVCGHKGAFCL